MKRPYYIIAAVLVSLSALAADITYSLGWTYDKGGRKRQKQNTTIQTNLNAVGVLENVQRIGKTNVALEVGTIATPGFFYAKNLSITSWVAIGVTHTAAGTNFIPFLRIPAGATVQCWLTDDLQGWTLQAQIDTSSAEDQLWLDYSLTER